MTRRQCARPGPIAASVLLCTLAAAQAVDLGPHSPILGFRSLTTDDGLAHSAVHGIAHDRHGFTWIATRRGLQRWDGHVLRTFRPAGEGAAPGPYSHRTVHVDRAGVLWTTENESAVFRFDEETETFDRIAYDETDPRRQVSTTCLRLDSDANGRVWVATYGGGALVLDPATGEQEWVLPASDPSEEPVGWKPVHLAVAPDGTTVWIADSKGLLLRVRGDERRTVRESGPSTPDGLAPGAVEDVDVDAAGRPWVTFADLGPTIVDPETGTLEVVLPAEERARLAPFTEVAFDDERRPWLGTRWNGLALWCPKSGRAYDWTHHPGDARSLAGDWVTRLSVDDYGTIWVGTQKDGVSWAHPWAHFLRRYTHDGSEGSLVEGSVWGIAEDPNGLVWIGTDRGIARFDPRTETFLDVLRTVAPEWSGRQIASIARGFDGRMWFACDGRLAAIEPTTLALETFEDSAVAESLRGGGTVHVLAEGPELVWLGTNAGLARWNPETDEVRHFAADPEDPRALAHPRITRLLRDRTGTLWVATNGGGLHRHVEATDDFDRFEADGRPGALSDGLVWSLCEAHDGTLWVGTLHGGLCRFDRGPGTFRVFGEECGLPDSTVYGIVEDAAGHLWLSSNDGLARFDPRAERATAFGAEYGLQDPEFNCYSYCRTSAGRLYFGGVLGLNVFDPADARRSTLDGQVRLSDLLLFHDAAPLTDVAPKSPLDRPLHLLDEVALGPDDRVFGFTFAARDSRVSARQRYAYRLAGWDRRWTITEPGVNRASFMGIDPGRYEFEVHAVGPEDELLQPGARLAVVVRASWWRGPVALGAYALLAAIAVGALVVRARRRRDRERAQQQLLERRVEEQTRELTLELEHRSRMERELLQAQKMKAVVQLADGIAHDFNNMLTAILGYTSMAARGGDELSRERLARFLEGVDEAARHSKELVSRMLLFSRGSRSAPETLALAEHVTTSLRLVRGSTPPALATSLEAPEHDPLVRIDPVELDQIVVNLVMNARDALGEVGRVRLLVREPRGIVARCASCAEEFAGRYVELTCSDDGPGIPEDVVDRVFEPYFTTRAERGGTGMGLSVVHGIVHRAGGHLLVESGPKGTAIRVCFPERTSEERVEVLVPVTPPTESPAAAPRLLLVEDEEAVANVIVDLLESAGYDVHVEADGREGFAAASRARNERRPYDLILTDQRMPRMTGLQMARALRDEGDRTPLVLMTGHAAETDRREALEQGLAAFVAKPFELDELLRLLEEARRSGESQRPTHA